MKRLRLLERKRKYWYSIQWMNKKQQGSYILSDSKPLKDVDYDVIKRLMLKTNVPEGIESINDLVILNISRL